VECNPFYLHSFLLSVSTIKITDFLVQVNILGIEYGSNTMILVLEGIESIFNADSYPHTFVQKFASTSMSKSTFSLIPIATFAIMWTYTCT